MFVLLAGVRFVVASGGEWTPEVFDYDRPARLEVIEKGVPKDKLPDTRQKELVFKNLRGEEVSVLMTVPPKGNGPWPAVVLVHALGSDRRQISRDLGKALVSQGFACVAMDLPKHGDRAAKAEKGKMSEKGEELFVADDPAKTYRNIVGAITDIRQTIDLVKERKDLNSDDGVPMVGYSLGAWFATVTGASDRRVSKMVLQCVGAAEGGAKGKTKSSDSGRLAVLQRYPTLRAETAISHFGPRPVLMQSGKKDPFISQDGAKFFYQMVEPPKELRWYDSGHILPEQAATDAAEWVKRM